MDTCLDVGSIYDYVHLLAVEGLKHSTSATLSDVLLEQRGGDFYKTRFLAAVSTDISAIDPLHPDKDDINGAISAHEEFWNNNMISSYMSAYALDNDIHKILLNEQQQYYNETISSDYKYIRLYLSCCTNEYRKKLLDFYNNSLKYSTTYMIEHGQVNGDKNAVKSLSSGCVTQPLYEFEDVCVKSKNEVITSKLLDFDAIPESAPSKTEDFYLPDSAKFTEFCQIGDQTYFMSKSTNESPKYLNLQEHESVKSVNAPMQLCTEQLPTYVYQSLSAARVSSYVEYFAKGNQISDFYGNVTSLPNVEYSYIAKVPMSKIVKEHGKTKYDNGNIYAGLFSTKSMYDALYSMQMSSESSLQNCRDYVEVKSCAGKPYLKYNDNVSYIDGQKTQSSLYSYPKIESLDAVATKSAKAHKSYFFSVNIKDAAMDYLHQTADDKIDASKKTYGKLKMQIRHDITEAVKQIVHNVCPVQTQLFEVQFNGENGEL